ncbi:MAG: 50S ribosomal protein L25 [Armatimonadetes bacterium]|nr:50S ribosomal protein L25 [Armatimonadota bacterium]
MANVKLEANYRSDMTKGHTKAIRRAGCVTGSVFGHDSEPVSIEFNLRELVDAVKASEAGVKSLIDLKIKGSPAKSDGIVIVKEFTKEPLTRKVLDIQFQRVHMKEKINVGVPIVLVGEAPGVKLAAILEHSLDELQISCLPGNIPPKIEVDVSGLGSGQHISVSDLTLDSAIEVLSDPNSIVCACVAHHVSVKAEEEAPAGATEAPAPGGGQSE